MFVPIANQQTQDPLTSKMAPWPETGTEPKEPDKTSNKSSESELAEAAAVAATPSELVEEDVTAVNTEEKQIDGDKPDPDVTALNDGQLRELLDEALSYRRPTDRVGKSPLFRELLQEAESDDPKCSAEERSAVLSRRRGNHRHHHASSSSSSGETKGGSLQNLVQALSTEFVNESNQFYTGGGYSIHGGGGGSSRGSRRLKRGGVVSVSARQREGGSLPSNVNASGSVNIKTLMFEDLRKSGLPPFLSGRKTPVAKENYLGLLGGDVKPPAKAKEATSECGKVTPVKEFDYVTMTSDYPTSLKSVFGMDSSPDKNESGSSVDIDDAIAKDASRKLNHVGGGGDCACTEDTEMEEVQQRRVVNYTTHATLEVAGHDEGSRVSEHDVDATVSIPILSQSALMNGNISSTIQLPASYTAVGSLLETEDQGNNKSALGDHDAKFSSSYTLQPTVSVVPHKKERGSWFSTSTYTGEAITKLSFQNMDDLKLLAVLQNKAVDENGNALTTSAAERKAKQRKPKPKTQGVHKEYFAEQVTGHRGDDDIDCLLSFIESDKERKSKGNHKGRMRGGSDRHKLAATTSLEDISSRTTIDDMTSDCEQDNVVVRRPKKQSTLDEADLRGDRRSWGTEEGQQYYCAAGGGDDTYPTARRKRRDREAGDVLPPPAAEETEFLVVMKKQRRKKQPRRSCSGGRGDFFDESRRSHCNGSSSRGSGGERSCAGRGGGGGGFPPHDRDVLYQYRRPRSPCDMRRKSTSSMPPSDKSDSSDLDSVHSLPVSSTVGAGVDRSGGSTPLASYADIAKISSAAPVNVNINAGKWPAIAPQHNAQFITGSRVSIGAPPVGALSRPQASEAPPPPAVHHDDGGMTTDQHRPVARVAGDPRQHKRTDCAPPVNFKVIPPYQNEDHCEKTVVESCSTKSTKNSAARNMDARNIVPLVGSDSDDAVVIVRNNSKPSLSDNVTTGNAAQANDSATLACHEDFSVAKSDLGDNKGNVKDNDILAKDAERREQASMLPPANPRPAVIIMDEKCESVCVNENLTSEITFGFEINELLLMSEDENDAGECVNGNRPAGGERMASNGMANSARTCEKARKVSANKKNSKTNINQSKAVVASQNVADSVTGFPLDGDQAYDNQVTRDSVTCDEGTASTLAHDDNEDEAGRAVTPRLVESKVGEEFAARFRPPADNHMPLDHTTLVTYISLAWDGVLKSGGITYYSDLSG